MRTEGQAGSLWARRVKAGGRNERSQDESKGTKERSRRKRRGEEKEEGHSNYKRCREGYIDR